MKKVFFITVICLLILSQITLAEEWGLVTKLDNFYKDEEINAELWETSSEGVISNKNNALVKNNVSLNGVIVKSYESYTQKSDIIKPLSAEVKEKNKKYYPNYNYLKIIYSGFNKSSIFLTIYKEELGAKKRSEVFGKINSISNDLDNMLKEESKKLINTMRRLDISDKKKIKDIAVKQNMLMHDHYLGFNNYNREKIEINTSKILKFDNDLIPDLRIQLNKRDSDIKVEVVK